MGENEAFKSQQAVQRDEKCWGRVKHGTVVPVCAPVPHSEPSAVPSREPAACLLSYVGLMVVFFFFSYWMVITPLNVNLVINI